MRRKLLFFIAFILLLSGCGSQSADAVANPYEIKTNSEILSIYDSQTKFEENGFKVFYDVISLSSDNDFAASFTYEGNRIVVDNNDNISIMTIYDENIVTHKSISVGDDSSKIEDAFKYESRFDHEDSCSYDVSFDKDGKEIKAGGTTERAYVISYEVKNSKIQYITIAIE